MNGVSGYFDLQVNGYAGIDLNADDLTGGQLHALCLRLRDDGVAGILATIITEHLDQMIRRIRHLVDLRARDPLAAGLIRGIHIEGPFLTPADGYPGGHPRDAILPADVEATKRLLEAGDGLVRLVTLAPEHDAGFQVIRFLAGQGIVVSAGHTDASLDQLRGAIDAGLAMCTHLGNGCPPVLPRHDNIVQRALGLADRLWLCFIADGVHVPFFALENYLRLAGLERCIVVTDAITAAGLGPGRYRAGRWDIQIGEDMVARSPDGSHLLGSTVTMKRSFENLVCHLGLKDDAALRLTSGNPRRALEGNPPPPRPPCWRQP